MAMPRVLCRARLWLKNDFSVLSKYSTAINSISVNKCVQIQVVRQFRTNFSVNLVTKEKNEKDKDKDSPRSTSSSSDSDQTDDSDSDDDFLQSSFNKHTVSATEPEKERIEPVLSDKKEIYPESGLHLLSIKNIDNKSAPNSIKGGELEQEKCISTVYAKNTLVPKNEKEDSNRKSLSSISECNSDTSSEDVTTGESDYNPETDTESSTSSEPRAPLSSLARKSLVQNEDKVTEVNEGRKTKKRKSNNLEWKKNVAKRLKDQGKAYVSATTNKQMRGREIGPPCKESCRIKCNSKITNETRNNIFDEYWALGDDDVTVEYHRGLPKITVPLPSRKEQCSFTLKPISNTVGDFLEMLKKEDKGIDRVVCKSKEGIRIASSNTIETLLDDDFKLIINDNSYNVNTPKAERLTGEEIQSLNDVKTLVSKLYAALHIQDHQLTKENELLTQLETLRQEVQPLEEQRNEIELVAHRRSNWLGWAGLGLMSVQFGILARLTWWEYSWDIMEPVTYFVTYGTAMAAYAYFVLTKEEYVLTEVRDRQHLMILHKKAKKLGVDITKYNQLKDEIHKIEYKLNKLRNPLKLHLPPTRTQPVAQAVPTEQKSNTEEKTNAQPVTKEPKKEEKTQEPVKKC